MLRKRKKRGEEIKEERKIKVYITTEYRYGDK